MRYISIASGSSGNCQFVEYKNTRILIDAGLSGKKIEKNLKSRGIDPSTIDAILVTHEHRDHVTSVGVLSRRYNIKVFSNIETAQAMTPVVKKINSENIYIFENNRAFNFKDLKIKAFDTFHDCQKGCGFVIMGNKKISLLTDTGWVNSNAFESMKGSSLYYLESNHDVDMLINGRYTWASKKRIMSTKGHLSNENCAEVLEKLLSKNQEIVVLGHLSNENNNPEIAAKTNEQYLNSKYIIRDVDYTLDVAPRYEAGKVYDL